MINLCRGRVGQIPPESPFIDHPIVIVTQTAALAPIHITVRNIGSEVALRENVYGVARKRVVSVDNITTIQQSLFHGFIVSLSSAIRVALDL